MTKVHASLAIEMLICRLKESMLMFFLDGNETYSIFRQLEALEARDALNQLINSMTLEERKIHLLITLDTL